MNARSLFTKEHGGPRADELFSFTARSLFKTGISAYTR